MIPTIKPKYTVWHIKTVADAIGHTLEDKCRLVIPPYQRPHVWDKKDELALVDTFNHNRTIPNLLLHHQKLENGQDIYTIIDGQQRSTAIYNYFQKPVEDFSIDKIEQDHKDFLTKICKAIYPKGCDQALTIKVKKAIEEYFLNTPSVKKYSDYKLHKLVEVLNQKLQISIDINCLNELSEIVDPVIDEKQELFEWVKENVQIPVTIWEGPINDCMIEYKTINSTGVDLTKFDVYAANWPSIAPTLLDVKNDNIIKAAINKYEAYEASGALRYDRDIVNEIKTTKKLNVYDYVFAFSKYLVNAFPVLAKKGKKSANDVEDVGFELLSACLAKNVQVELDNLYKYIINKTSDELTIIEENICNVLSFVSQTLAPIINLKLNKKNSSSLLIPNQAQITSFAAWVFDKKFDQNGQEKPTWQKQKTFVASQIIKYFIFDLSNNYWGSATLSKIDSTLATDRYSTEIADGVLLDCFKTYWNETKSTRKQNCKFVSPSIEDKIFLSIIYNAGTFTATQQLNGSKYDIEHWIPKAKMEQLLKVVANDPTNIPTLPVTHLANLGLLPASINRSKKDKTLYQAGYTADEIKDIETKYSFTSSKMFDWVNKPFEKGQVAILFNDYNDFINQRFIQYKTKFSQGLKNILKGLE